jgi:hypothetical protein
MLRTLSAPQTPRPESQKLIKLKIIQQQVGHECDSSTAVYTNPRELHQTGEKPQVSWSAQVRKRFTRFAADAC